MSGRFAGIEIDENRREVLRHGKAVAVEPRAFDLIAYLVRNRNRVVSKGELLDALWPGQDVLESALSICVHRARRALDGRDGGRNMIQNLARRGYRFVAPPAEAAAPIPAASEKISRRLIGRGREMARLTGLLEEALAGCFRLILIGGEPGIGKTRLLQELAPAARACGFDVFWGQIGVDPERGAFTAWWQLLSAYAACSDSEDLRARLGPEGLELARLVPSLRERLRLDGPESAVGAPGDRAALFDAITAFIGRAAAARPLLLILDDLHFADGDSLDLLRHVAAAAGPGPLLIAGSYRDTEARAGTELGDLIRALPARPECERLALGALDDSEMLVLVEQLAAGPVPDRVCMTILERAEGNPLFVREYWRYLVTQGVLIPGPGGWVSRGDPSHVDVPGGVRGVIRRRVEQLAAPCRAMLMAGALVGREFLAEDVAEACGASPGEVSRVLDEALRMRVLLPVNGGAEKYRFSHVLFREHLAAALSDSARRALHRRIGEALERRCGSEGDRHLPELAEHFTQGADADSAGRAIGHGRGLPSASRSRRAGSKARSG